MAYWQGGRARGSFQKIESAGAGGASGKVRRFRVQELFRHPAVNVVGERGARERARGGRWGVAGGGRMVV